MTLSRFLLWCCGFLLLGLVAGAYYTYPRLPSVIAQQLELALEEYGVETVELSQLSLSSQLATTAIVRLRGQRDGLHFVATLESLNLRYDGSSLLRGELHSLRLESLDIQLEQAAHSPSTNSPSTNSPANEAISLGRLLPRRLLAQLPVAALDIPQLQLKYTGPNGVEFTTSGSVSAKLPETVNIHLSTRYLDALATTTVTAGPRKPLAVELTLAEGTAAVATLAAQLSPENADRWQWQLQGQLDYAPALTLLRRLSTYPTFPVSVSPLDALSLQGTTTIEGVIQHADQIAFYPESTSLLQAQFNGTLAAVHTLAQLDFLPYVTVGAAQLQTSLTKAEGEDGEITITIAPAELTASVGTTPLGLTPESLRWLGWDTRIPLRLTTVDPIDIARAPDASWSVNSSQLLVALGNRNSEVRWDSAALNFALQPGDTPEVATQLDASLKIRLHQQQLPQFEVQLSQQGSFEDSQITLTAVDTAESLRMQFGSTVNLSSGKGDYSFAMQSLDLPYAVTSLQGPLNKLGLLDQSIEISSGTVTLNTALQSDDFSAATLTQQSHLEMENVSGVIDEYTFANMALQANFSGTEKLRTAKPVSFSMAELDLGFIVTGIQARIALPQATPANRPKVTINSFSAGVFGGQVVLSEPAPWDFGATTNTLRLQAKNWQLADLVALQTDQDIRAVGILEGELPITVDAGRIIIEEGYLRALPPGGSIRYIASEKSRALAASSSELGMAMDLLSDFHYEVLGSDVQLDKAGNLLMGLSLGGRNPSEQQGRPVRFNINLEQNLDPLLQTLRLNDRLVEEIERRYE